MKNSPAVCLGGIKVVTVGCKTFRKCANRFATPQVERIVLSTRMKGASFGDNIKQRKTTITRLASLKDEHMPIVRVS